MRVRRNADRRLLSYARRMRSDATDAERRLWGLLRERQLARFRFRRQVPISDYIVDFYCVKARLAIELDGGQHAQAVNQAHDEARDLRLAAAGVHILRFWDDDVLRYPDTVLQRILEELHDLNVDA